MKKIHPAIIDALLADGVGILPTDTIYGIVGSAFSKSAVENIYRLRKRDTKKPMIVLVGDIDDLRLFGIRVTPELERKLAAWWPGKVSVIMEMGDERSAREFRYLHRGTKTLAFRLPRPLWLRALLQKTGPLVAPSANFEGKPPATTMREAERYFGKKVDFYIDGGRLVSKPSTLLAFRKGKWTVLRKGAGAV